MWGDVRQPAHPEPAPAAVADASPGAVARSQRSGATAYLGARRAREQSSAPRSEDDTPIFRSLASQWMTQPAESETTVTWSPTEADSGWDAAARATSAHAEQESPSGLPMRRPGRQLVPGQIDPAAGPVETAEAVRDPEAIRRSLSRHMGGVASARAQTSSEEEPQREEADVQH
jgi:hypothetical protein